MALTKICGLCKEEKPWSEFYIRKDNGKPQWQCKSCDNKGAKEWRRKNKRKMRDNHLKYTYGISIEDYEDMLYSQKGLCSICGFRFIEGERYKNACVDHDHKTGKVRALLCHKCNFGLGYLNDSAELLRAAADYIDYHEEL